MDILIKIAQLVLSLSILIVLHELGHFLPAKWFKTRVEKFYLFFDPWFELAKKKIGETEYGIGWLPLGGYVKIAGMVDESFDTEQMKQPPQPWEFRSKPAWQRLIIMLGGVTVNFILGFFIYAMIFWAWGEDYLPTKSLTYGVQPDSLGQLMGIQPGDNVVAVDTVQLDRFNPGAVKMEIILNKARTLTVERNGEKQALTIPDDVAKSLVKYENKGYNLYTPRMPFVVKQFEKGSPAEAAGMKTGDRIIALNGQPTPFYHDFFKMLTEKKLPDTKVDITVLRSNASNGQDTISIAVVTTSEGRIGAATESLKTEHQSYTLAQALPAGISRGVGFLGSQIKAFGKMFSGDIPAKESLGSFISIGSMFPSSWDWQAFWNLTAMLSLVLAFINLLPIPALDGGHVMFLIWEVFTGKKPSDKFMEIATMTGFVVLISIMVFALGNDIFRLL